MMKPTSSPLQVEDYEVLQKIGEGTAGCVYRAIHKVSKEEVALKVLKAWSYDKSSRDEVALLQHLSGAQHVIPLKEIIVIPNTSPTGSPISSAASPSSPSSQIHDDSVVLVFPYYEHDLSGLLSEHKLDLPQVKCYLKQLLIGLAAIHARGCMHRDIKAANLLLNNKGQLTIADFGTATSYKDRTSFSNKVVTLWYRAPELLLGTTQYGPEIDMWSVGCVFIELLTSRNFLPGQNEEQQLEVICRLCGTPDESNFPGSSKLPLYDSLLRSPSHPGSSPNQQPNSPPTPTSPPTPHHYPRRLRDALKASYDFPEEAYNLLDDLLTLDPKRRITAEQALNHKFFTTEPLPYNPSDMPTYSPVHVLDATMKRAKQQSQQNTAVAYESNKRPRDATPKYNNGPNNGNCHVYSNSTYYNNSITNSNTRPPVYRKSTPSPQRRYGGSPQSQWGQSPQSSTPDRQSSPLHPSPSHYPYYPTRTTSPQSSPSHAPPYYSNASSHSKNPKFLSKSATSYSKTTQEYSPNNAHLFTPPAKITTQPQPNIAPPVPSIPSVSTSAPVLNPRKRRAIAMTLPTDLYLSGEWNFKDKVATEITNVFSSVKVEEKEKLDKPILSPSNANSQSTTPNSPGVSLTTNECAIHEELRSNTQSETSQTPINKPKGNPFLLPVKKQTESILGKRSALHILPSNIDNTTTNNNNNNNPNIHIFPATPLSVL